MGETHLTHVNEMCPDEANRTISDEFAMIEIYFQKHWTGQREGGDGIICQEPQSI